MLEGSLIPPPPPGGFIRVLGKFLQPFDMYRLCSGAHLIDVPGHICLAGSVITSYSPQKLQGQVVRDILCWAVLHQVSTEENNLAKK